MKRNKFKQLLIVLCILMLLIPLTVFAQQDDPYRELIDAAGGVDEYPDANVITVFDSTVVLVEESGLSHTTIHTLTKLLTTSGAVSRSAVRLDYDPASNTIEIRKIIIHREDGTMESVDPSTAVDKFAPARMIYWGGRMQVIGIPDLQSGDALEVEYYKKGFMIAYLNGEDDSRYIPPMRGHYYDTVIFGGGHPVKEKVYCVRMVKDRPLQYKVYNGNIACETRFDREFNLYTFSKTDIPVYEYEPRSPGASDYIPKVVMATVADWPEKSRWFYHVNEDSVLNVYGQDMKPFEFSEEIRKKAEEIAAPYKTHREKRWAILHWVAQHIRYSGITMGKGEGYTLHPGIMIYRDRSGVCKDIAGMALTMFRALGYKAVPTMTMAGARVEEIPADQFNHCVVAVDISGEEGVESFNLPGTKWEMYDPTWAPNSMDIWSMAEGEQHIVIGSEEGEPLRAIRPFKPEECAFDIKSTAIIDKMGNLTGKLVIQAVGYGDARLRRTLVYAGGSQDKWNRYQGYIANLAPGAELTDYYSNNVHDLSKSLALTLEYKIPDYALTYGNGLHYSSPGGKFVPNTSYLFIIFSGSNLKEREHPMHIWAPQQVNISETIEVPRGYKLDDFEAIDDGGDFADFKVTCKQKSRKVSMKYTYTVSERTISPEEYTQVKEIVDSMNDFADATIHLWRK